MAGELDFFAVQETIDSIFATYFEKFHKEYTGDPDFSINEEWNDADIDARYAALYDPKDVIEQSVEISVSKGDGGKQTFGIDMTNNSETEPYFRCTGDRTELSEWLLAWRLSHI